MTFSDKACIESENLAATLIHFDRGQKKAKEINLDTLDIPASQSTSTFSTEGTAYTRHLEPAQETDAEREYRLSQIDYERCPFFEKNKKLAKSINRLAEYNFTNKVLAAACDFTEMAEHHPRSPFIGVFGPLIEEELKACPDKPSGRLASFTTSYFWKEANWARLTDAVSPTTTKEELSEFFTQPLNTTPNERIIDALPIRIAAKMIGSVQRENLKFCGVSKKETPYLTINESEKLLASITKRAQQNFTNRILISTAYFALLANPFDTSRRLAGYGRNLDLELKENPDKPSPTLITLMTEQCLKDEDIDTIIKHVTPKTTKKELSDFLGTRENWSTGLRMIDYLNHYVVMEMARFLPDQDKLDLWSMKPEMVYDFNVGESLRKFSPSSQQKILDTIPDSSAKTEIQENMKHKLIGLHVSVGLMGGGNVRTDTLDIHAKFATIRKRRICSHADNRKFFPTQEHFRTSY